MHSPTFLFRMQRWSLKEYRHGPVKSTGILVEPPPFHHLPHPLQVYLHSYSACKDGPERRKTTVWMYTEN